MTLQRAEPQSAPRLQRLLRPRSVAIAGASGTRGSLGASVLGNLERMGFAGDIHLINPKRDDIGGRKCLKSPNDLPEGVDVAVLAIPRAAVLETLTAMASRKVGAAIIFAAGFAEGGADGLAEQREIARIAAESGMIIEGPNCLGLVNYVDNIPLTFIETPATALLNRPGIGIVSQSGAMAAILTATLASRDLGISYAISTGNEAASGVEDYLSYLIDDSNTHTLCLIVEQFRQPARFLQLAAKARQRGKTIVLLHPGRSSAARESAATHTGAMAGDYQLMKTKVERAGILLVETLEELGDCLEISVRCPALPAGGAAILTESGAFKALALDFCEQVGLPLPVMHDFDSPALRAALPDFVPVTNPVDLTAQALVDPDLYKRSMAALFEDHRFGHVILAIIQTDKTTSDIKFPPIIAALETLKPTKPLIFAGLDEGAAVPTAYIQRMRALGVPCFPSPDRAFRALAKFSELNNRDLSVSDAATLSASGLPPHGGVIAEYKAKQILAPLGVPFPAGRFAVTLAEAIAIAEDIGYPVVIKAQSAALSHKSDAGGVLLNLADANALKSGWETLFANVARHRSGLKLDCVLVEKMGQRGFELIIGAKNDPEWGPIILAGFGGVQAEILHDVRLLTPDMTRDGIIRELNLLKSAALLRGFRGSPPLDVEAAAEIILNVSILMRSERRILEIDLNPVVVYPAGQGAVALDALMLTAPQP